MRKAINQNRTVQLVLVGALALLGGLLLLKSQGSSGSEGEAAPPAAAPPASTAAPAPSGTAAAVPQPTVTPAVSGAGTIGVPVSMIPGSGLPRGLVAAYRDGKAVALLVRRDGAIDDALVRDSVELLRTLPDVEVYVTRAEHIARYAWLTQGVEVSGLPALVVLRPRKLSNGKPMASLSYGFRDSASVLQAVEDALYRGPTDRPYHP